MIDVKEKPNVVERAFLVGVQKQGQNSEQTEHLLLELEELVNTLGIPIVGKTIAVLREPTPRFLLGSGKVSEIIEASKAVAADVIIFDEQLSPAQQRSWEEEAPGVLVIDRQEVILDIFARRAHTKEAALQVELARLEYNLPRLKRAWGHLDRQRGGGAVQRDAGETQLELDQRMTRDRIAKVKRELEEVVQHRDVQRKKRMKVPLPSAAIVGYTNAGKSSLLRKLTGAQVLVEDKLFATLDPTTRKLVLPNRQVLLLTDTVGFVRKLPHTLVNAFKATLEEAVVADFLIHVLDVNNPDIMAHHATTLEVLKELGAKEKSIITVLNKCDKVEDPLIIASLKKDFPEACVISVRTGQGIDCLLARMEELLRNKHPEMKLLLPHARYDLLHVLYEHAYVLSEELRDDGVYVIAQVPTKLVSTFEGFRL